MRMTVAHARLPPLHELCISYMFCTVLKLTQCRVVNARYGLSLLHVFGLHAFGCLGIFRRPLLAFAYLLAFLALLLSFFAVSLMRGMA